MRGELEDKDKKIKELNIRLEVQRKQQGVNKGEFSINNQDLSKIDQISFLTTNEDRNSLRPSQLIFGSTTNFNPALQQEFDKMLE